MNIKTSRNKSKQSKNGKEKRSPKKITKTYLHNAGLYYLQRFASSSQQFKKVMLHKAIKSCHHHKEQEISICEEMIDELVEKFKSIDLLNDETYTRGMIISLRRQGKSKKAITVKLKSKGLEDNIIKQKLEEYDIENNESKEEAEFQAAMIFAKKKRLGIFDDNETDNKKALGRLARAGFSYNTARRVLKTEYDEDYI